MVWFAFQRIETLSSITIENDFEQCECDLFREKSAISAEKQFPTSHFRHLQPLKSMDTHVVCLQVVARAVRGDDLCVRFQWTRMAMTFFRDVKEILETL